MPDHPLIRALACRAIHSVCPRPIDFVRVYGQDYVKKFGLVSRVKDSPQRSQRARLAHPFRDSGKSLSGARRTGGPIVAD